MSNIIKFEGVYRISTSGNLACMELALDDLKVYKRPPKDIDTQKVRSNSTVNVQTSKQWFTLHYTVDHSQCGPQIRDV
jgi:hypothetical protein